MGKSAYWIVGIFGTVAIIGSAIWYYKRNIKSSEKVTEPPKAGDNIITPSGSRVVGAVTTSPSGVVTVKTTTGDSVQLRRQAYIPSNRSAGFLYLDLKYSGQSRPAPGSTIGFVLNEDKFSDGTPAYILSTPGGVRYTYKNGVSIRDIV